MDKSIVIKIFVVLVAIFFVVGMFTYFEREDIKNKAQQTGTNQTETYSAAEAVAKGKLQSFENIIYISPWNESYRTAIEALKSEKQIDYINLADNIGVVTLAPKANLSYIREKLEDLDSDIFADATVIFDDQVNFTFLNGTTKLMSVGSTTAKLDPSTPVGDLIDANILADLSQRNIKNIRITLKPKITNITQEVELNCSDSYEFSGEVSWTNRNINVSKYAVLLNISEDAIDYQKYDYVFLPGNLNSTEMETLKDKNLSFLNFVLEDRIAVNTTNKDEVETALSYLMTNATAKFVYQNSLINATFKANESDAPSILTELNSSIENLTVKRNCETSLRQVIMGGNKYFVEKRGMKAEQYIDIGKAINSKKNANIEVYSIGRSVTGIILLDVQ